MICRDPERIDRARHAMVAEGLDALLCSAPQHVLMLSQYWPVLGSRFVLVTPDAIGLLVPEDEQELAKHSSADVIQSFITASLDQLTTAEVQAFPALQKLCSRSGGLRGRIGIEMNGYFMPPSYVSVQRYGVSLLERLRSILPDRVTTEVIGRLNDPATMRSDAAALPAPPSIHLPISSGKPCS